jgi:hypothetical protein
VSRRRIILLVALALVGVAAVLSTQLGAPASRRDVAPALEKPAPVPPAPASNARRAPAEPASKPVAPPAAVESAPPPATATLRIDSDVPGASVFIDRVYLGTTPLTVPNVTPGPHRLNGSVDGHEGIAETIDVEAGPRDIMLKFKEIRLDVRVDVVHKHGVGSCTGVLSATPRGIRYVTANANDAFDVPLADITALELDFLAKNLRLKLKSGRTYNFTEAGGGADQLYAFHRDVNKARAVKNQPRSSRRTRRPLERFRAWRRWRATLASGCRPRTVRMDDTDE